MKLLGNRILVKPIFEETQRKSGIIIPETVKASVNKGLVISTGPKVSNVETNQKIIFKEGAGLDVKENEQSYLMMYEHDIIAII